MRKATKRLPVKARPKVEVLAPVSRYSPPVRHVHDSPSRVEEFEEIVETTRTVKRRRVETGQPAQIRSSEPMASVIGRIVAILIMFVVTMICAGLSVVALVHSEMAMAIIAFGCTIGLTGFAVSTARYQH